VGNIAEPGGAIGRHDQGRALDVRGARGLARRPLVCAAVCAGLLVGLAFLVGSGATARIDHTAQDHLAPLVHGPQRSHPFLLTWLNEWLTIAMSLAAPVMSTVLALAGCAMLVLRGRRDRALLWAGVFVAGFLIEVLGKLFVDSSFPSGHTMRALLLAGLAAELWPRRRPWFWGFAAFVILGVQLKGIHPPSDIAGGILAAAMLLLIVSAVGQKPAWRPRSQSVRT
jgi:membrane-associated phospholipid phosphatase